jgi:hypothetical protein
LREEAENSARTVQEVYSRPEDLQKLGAARLLRCQKMSGEGAEKVSNLGLLPLDRRKKSAYNRAD